MTRSFAVGFAILLLVVLGGELISPRPAALEQATAAMPSLQELHAAAGVHKLPLQDIDDQSLMFPSSPDVQAPPKP
jgi:hypothetical protein